MKGIILNLSIPKTADTTGLNNKTVWLNKNNVMQLITTLYGQQDKFRDIVECKDLREKIDELFQMLFI